MKVGHWLVVGCSALLFARNGVAQEAGVLDCEFKRIVPEEADFFTSGFRPAPKIGSRIRVDFDSEQITSLIFDDGQPFFSVGEATLSRLYTAGRPVGYGGVRIGNHGTYIGMLAGATLVDAAAGVYTSRFLLTHSYRDQTLHLVTSATHYGDLECRSVVIEE